MCLSFSLREQFILWHPSFNKKQQKTTDDFVEFTGVLRWAEYRLRFGCCTFSHNSWNVMECTVERCILFVPAILHNGWLSRNSVFPSHINCSPIQHVSFTTAIDNSLLTTLQQHHQARKYLPSHEKLIEVTLGWCLIIWFRLYSLV